MKPRTLGDKTMSYYIGIDLGTSSVKMLMMTENGDLTKSVTRE